MAETKVSTVRLSIDNDKFEILVKPDPALEYKQGKRKDLTAVLVSDEIYSDANKGSRASTEKISKYFKTMDMMEVAKQIILRGELNLTTEQRRKMVEEKKKQIIQYLSKAYVDPRTHLPHPAVRIQSAMEDVRLVIDPFKKAEDQAKTIVDALRKILPLRSETVQLTITIPAQFSAQSFSALKSSGDFKAEQWLSDGSLRVTIELNAGMKGAFIDRLASITKGTAHVKEGL